MNIKMNIAKNILFYRKQKKLSQKDLAEKLGVKHNTISSWENGTNSVDIESLFLISEILGVPINELYGVEKKSPESLAESDRLLVERYQSLDDKSKNLVNIIIDFEYEQTKKRSSEKADEFNLTEEEQDFLMKFREIKDVDVRVLSRMLNSMYERKDRERSSANHTDGKEA